MLPVEILDPKPGEKILDLCAAPGGKTVAIAGRMKGQGLLVANDNSVDRMKPLVKNIERYGVSNCVVTNEDPTNLIKKFTESFDKILVDAPCSGEGMFRKDENAIKSYEKFKVDQFTMMQENILQCAHHMLKSGGFLLYSTCTFNPEENERMVLAFSKKYNYHFVDFKKVGGIENGRPQWGNDDASLLSAGRIWPHKSKGEGRFVALLQKGESTVTKDPLTTIMAKKKKSSLKNELIQSYQDFEKHSLNIELQGHFFSEGENLYHLPVAPPNFHGLKVSKFGLFLGRLGVKGFEPSHSFLISLKAKEIKNVLFLSLKSLNLQKYLKGETLILDEDEEIRDLISEGLVAVCVDEYPVGWGKLKSGVLKNLFPKGWRK
jgi:NOL1/NOP2/fmu family ribosome biogenesis protein/precorrin-6B methylase 2